MTTALEQIMEEYVSLQDLCVFFGMAEKRVKDLISMHKTDKKFMRAYKVSAGKYLFHKDVVLKYIQNNSTEISHT